MSNVLAYGDKLIAGASSGGGGSTGGGHVIQNASGTDLEQRDTLQFSGYLQATDDSTNSKTVVSDTTTISWDDWNELTDAEKEGTHWIITDVPDVDGKVNTDLMTKLWENPSPSSAFAAQTIILNSDDYDFLLILARAAYSTNRDLSVICAKGESVYLTFPYYSSGNLNNATRLLTYTDDTHIAVADAMVSSSTNNLYHIPISIYGFKKTITIDTSALIANVSTDASKCMIDEDTSVVDKLDDQKIIVLTGTCNSSGGFSSVINYPTGFNKDNTMMLSLQIYSSSGYWRSGEGLYTSYTRTFVQADSNGIQVYTNNTDLYDQPFKVAVTKVV